MEFKLWISSYLGRPVLVRDLVDLATVDTDDAHALLTSLYSWKYEHIVTSAKALAGAGSAIGVATLVPLIQANKATTIEWGWIIAAWITGAVLILSGAAAFSFARRVHSEFVAAQALLSELLELRPFIRRFRSEESSL
jgi:hypothetical protein